MPVRLSASSPPLPELLTPACTLAGAVEATGGPPDCRLSMRWQAHHLLQGDHRVGGTLGKQGLGDQRTIVGVTTDHIWAGSGRDFQSFVDRSSHDDSPCAPCVTRPRVVVHPTPSRSPPGTGHVSVDAISTTAHLVPLAWRFARLTRQTAGPQGVTTVMGLAAQAAPALTLGSMTDEGREVVKMP